MHSRPDGASRPSFQCFLAHSPHKEATGIRKSRTGRVGDRKPRRQEVPFFQTLIGEPYPQNASGAPMPRSPAKKTTTTSKRASVARVRQSTKSGSKFSGRNRRVSAESGEVLRMRAEAEAAIAEARKSHERLREA